MSNRTNSAPAFLQICGRPGAKNSNTIAPKARPPAASVADGIVAGALAVDGARYRCAGRTVPRIIPSGHRWRLR